VVLPLTSAVAYAPRDFDAVSRTSTQFPVLAHYLAMIVWPNPDAFRFYYDDFPLSPTPWSTPATAVATAAVVATALAAWIGRKRWPLFSFGIAWFFACHAITSSPIPLELAFEHRNYLASLGILVSAGAAVAALTRRLNADARVTIGVALVAALAALGALQSATWADPMRLALTLESRAPESPRASYALALRMIDAAGGDRDSPAWSLGMATLHRASGLPRASTLPTQAEIVLSSRAGMPVDASVWSRFRTLLLARPLGPEATESLYAVVNCRISGACRLDDAELVATAVAVVDANPDNATAHTMYANVAWNVMHDQPLAIPCLPPGTLPRGRRRTPCSRPSASRTTGAGQTPLPGWSRHIRRQAAESHGMRSSMDTDPWME
jgi:protein O-mannosyl-transferase